MIVKEIAVEGIEQNRYEVQVLGQDNSLRGELFSVDGETEIGERLHNVVFVEPWPFEMSESELEELAPRV